MQGYANTQTSKWKCDKERESCEKN
jgi:hypothetical protein